MLIYIYISLETSLILEPEVTQDSVSPFQAKQLSSWPSAKETAPFKYWEKLPPLITGTLEQNHEKACVTPFFGVFRNNSMFIWS